MSRFGKLVYDESSKKVVYDDAGDGKLVYADSVKLQYIGRTTDGFHKTSPIGADKSTCLFMLRQNEPSYYERLSAFFDSLVHQYWVSGGYHYGNFVLIRVDLDGGARAARGGYLTDFKFYVTNYSNTGGGSMWLGCRAFQDYETHNLYVLSNYYLARVQITGTGDYTLTINSRVTNATLWFGVWQDDAVGDGDIVQATFEGYQLFGSP
jgi:hypothetical protein